MLTAGCITCRPLRTLHAQTRHCLPVAHCGCSLVRCRSVPPVALLTCLPCARCLTLVSADTYHHAGAVCAVGVVYARVHLWQLIRSVPAATNLRLGCLDCCGIDTCCLVLHVLTVLVSTPVLVLGSVLMVCYGNTTISPSQADATCGDVTLSSLLRLTLHVHLYC